MKLSDRALANRDDDILDRWGIAKTISDLIANTQTDSALRIGIYGSWGEGKTSVLRFVETLCRKADTAVCWFSGPRRPNPISGVRYITSWNPCRRHRIDGARSRREPGSS